MIEKVFSKEPATTLNADEAVSRGCALQCAILSPVFKVREFSVTDIQPYPIKLVWDNTSGEGQAQGEMEVFPVNHPVPFSKMLTFYKTETFQVNVKSITIAARLHLTQYLFNCQVPNPKLQGLTINYFRPPPFTLFT